LAAKKPGEAKRLFQTIAVDEQVRGLPLVVRRSAEGFQVGRLLSSDFGSTQAIIVVARGLSLSVLPEITTVPVKRLQEAFPATLPESTKARLAFELATTGVPARSTSVHSESFGEKETAFGADAGPALCVEEQEIPIDASIQTPRSANGRFMQRSAQAAFLPMIKR
jgi:hypothetical protein